MTSIRATAIIAAFAAPYLVPAIATAFATLYLVPFAWMLNCQYRSPFGFCSAMFGPLVRLGDWWTAYLWGVSLIEIAGPVYLAAYAIAGLVKVLLWLRSPSGEGKGSPKC